MNPAVDKYFSGAKTWKKELAALRTIILDCGLTEELKWGNPCYMFQKTNLLIIGELKESCVLSFFNGTLLSDANGILIKPGPSTQTVRIIRFASVREIVQMEPILKAYIYEAIEVEKAGLKVNLEESTALVLPEEFQVKLKENAALKAAFNALTPGTAKSLQSLFFCPKTIQNACFPG